MKHFKFGKKTIKKRFKIEYQNDRLFYNFVELIKFYLFKRLIRFLV